jgi:hypothetical protein
LVLQGYEVVLHLGGVIAHGRCSVAQFVQGEVARCNVHFSGLHLHG